MQQQLNTIRDFMIKATADSVLALENTTLKRENSDLRRMLLDELALLHQDHRQVEQTGLFGDPNFGRFGAHAYGAGGKHQNCK